MKITTRRDPMQHALATVARAVSSRSTLPILSNILIEAEADSLTLSATDLEMGIRARLPVEVEDAGRTTLPARLFTEVIGAQPTESSVTLESDEQDHVSFRCGKSVVEVHGLPADEFPVVPTIDQESSIRLPHAALKRMLGQCLIAVSGDETRARLTGMLMQLEGDRLRLVATDTHRLATRSEPIPEVGDVDVRAIVPARALREVERLLVDDAEAMLDVDFTDTQVQFRFEHVTVISRLIEGEFPNYKKVIPATHDWTLTLDIPVLRESVRRCAIVSREDNRKLVVRGTPAGTLQLSAASSKIGRADEEVGGVTVVAAEGAGDSIEIAFNADYLLDVLNHLHADEVRLELTAPNLPCAVRPVSEDDYVYVLMPMQMV